MHVRTLLLRGSYSIRGSAHRSQLSCTSSRGSVATSRRDSREVVQGWLDDVLGRTREMPTCVQLHFFGVRGLTYLTYTARAVAVGCRLVCFPGVEVFAREEGSGDIERRGYSMHCGTGSNRDDLASQNSVAGCKGVVGKSRSSAVLSKQKRLES